MIGRDTVKHIYEGDFIAALKVPKREILAINQILALNMCDIHLPLTVVVQYACFSIVVSALIPIVGYGQYLFLLTSDDRMALL